MNVLADLLERAIEAAPMLLGNRIIAEFEPMPTSLAYRESHARVVKAGIRDAAHDELKAFPSTVGRNAFLAAAFEHLTEIDDHEELIVAFGKRRGTRDESPTMLSGLWRGIGRHDEVGITPLLRHTLETQAAYDRSEIIFVHNHPMHDVKSLVRFLFGWTPLASSPDRNVALRMNTIAALKSMAGFSNHHRFYLVDEERLARFWLPSLEWFLEAFKRMGQGAPSSYRGP
jgi:hypothetical protein